MAKSTSKKAKVSMIAKELSDGKERDYIVAKYGKKWQAGTRTIDRYIKEAQEEAEDIQRETSAALRDESIQEAK